MGVLYHVHADWDAEAAVWVATSEDVPGLATEAPTMEALAKKLRTMIPELLEANRLLACEQPDAIAFGGRAALPHPALGRTSREGIRRSSLQAQPVEIGDANLAVVPAAKMLGGRD